MNTETQPLSIAVIGAGIVGVQLARAAQCGGADVTLFDAGDPGMATSFGNAGYLATDEIFPLAHGTVLRRLPRMLLNPLGPIALRVREFPRLLPWYVRYALACSTSRSEQSVVALATIQSQAVAAWERVIAREHIESLVVHNGAMTVFESDQGFASTRVQRETQTRHGVEWQALSGNEARDRVPELSRSIRHAVHYPAGRHVVNPLQVTRAIFDPFIADGGNFVNAPVTSMAQRSDDIDSIVADGREHRFDRIVVTAGHLSGRLLSPLGYRVPIVAERGYHVEMSHRETRLDMPVGAFERGFYVTPMSSGLRLAGTSEFSSADHDEPPTWARADILKRHVADVMPGLAEGETGRWMGHRPTMPDFLPVLGRVPGSANLFTAFGHHHLGLTLSAITAELLADDLTGASPALDMTPYALARFQ